MAWTLRSSLDKSRFVKFSDGKWSADKETSAALEQEGPYANALLTPTGPVYVSKGAGDEVALFLRAEALLPGVSSLEPGSQAPAVPAPPELPPGAVA